MLNFYKYPAIKHSYFSKCASISEIYNCKLAGQHLAHCPGPVTHRVGYRPVMD